MQIHGLFLFIATTTADPFKLMRKLGSWTIAHCCSLSFASFIASSNARMCFSFKSISFFSSDVVFVVEDGLMVC